MDGGSSDGSIKVISEYAARLKHWQSGADAGLYHAVEEGFRHSDAEIMGWLNADDMLCPWTLRLVLDVFSQLPQVECITSKYPLVANARGVVFRTDLLPGVNREDFLAGMNLPGQGWPATNFISQESTFWRRSLWDRVGGGFDHSLRLACDFELWSRFLDLTDLYVVESPMAIFRVHGGNLSVRQKAEYAQEASQVLLRQEAARPETKASLAERVHTAKAAAVGLPPPDVGKEVSCASISAVVFDETIGRYTVAGKGGCSIPLSPPVPTPETDAAPSTSRVEFVLRQLLASPPDIVSFDVFDTLLWRPFRRPKDLFLLLGDALGSEGLADRSLNARALAEARCRAERRARRRGATPEVTLSDISEELCRELDVTESERIREAELNLEKKHLQPHADTLAMIVNLHRAGIPYALCSDMYLPSAAIAEIVRSAAARVGIDLPAPRAVLVSGELGTGKADDLFRFLAEQTKIDPSRIVHVGDNEISDVACARRHGLASYHLPRSCPFAEEIMDGEEEWMPEPAKGSVDFGLSASRGELAAALLSSPQEKLTPFAYGACILGPVYAAFAAWVLAECRHRGITKLQLCMREGKFLARLINAAGEALGYNVESSVVWASRFALRSAALAEATPDLLSDFLQNVRAVDIKEDLLLGIALLDEKSARLWSQERLDKAALPVKLAWIKSHIDRNPGVIAAVRRVGSERKAGLLAHCKRAGLTDTSSLCLADVGWGGSIQMGMAEALRATGWRGTFHGLYLGTDQRIGRLAGANCTWSSFLYEAGLPLEPARIVQRTPELIEQACMSDEGSLRKFTGGGEPVLFENLLPAKQMTDIAALQEGMLFFAQNWWPRFALAGGLSASGQGLTAFKDRLRAIVSRSIMRPRQEEVEMFRDWKHDSNNGSVDVKPILGTMEAIAAVASGRVTHPWQLDWQMCYWPAGLFVALGRSWTGRLAGRTRFLIRSGEISSRIFGRFDPWPFVLRAWLALRLRMRDFRKATRSR